jgi:two-component system phosphate regulon sensor histidine kinase PhoR
VARPSVLGRSKAWFGVLALAVLAPAAGLAYLGVKSNLAERERARQAFVVGNQKEARFIAGAVDEAATGALDAVAPAFDERGPLPDAAARVRAAVGRADEQVFFIDAGGRVQWPPGAIDLAGAPRGEPERAVGEGGFSGYLDALRAERKRGQLLAEARVAEAAGHAAEAKKKYSALAAGDGDAAAQAILGLARLALAAGQPDEAAARFEELGRRFASAHDEEGLPYALVAEAGQAHAAAAAPRRLALYREIVDGRFSAPPDALFALAAQTRAGIDPRALSDAERGDLDAIDARAAARVAETRFAAQVQDAAAELGRAAEAEPQARRVMAPVERLWVYRRHAGGVLGVALAPSVLAGAADRALAGEAAAGNLPGGTRVRVDPGLPDAEAVGYLAAERPRLVAPFTVSLWGDDKAADRAARAQLVRYLALVGSLILVLAGGVWTTWRFAARERELSRLKSDFVSTVSHELKTPLTSIRMFGEMLREGVHGGDVERQARYHDVIVRESERLGRLIANVLDFAQIEKGARRYDPQPIAGAALAGEAVETYRRLADGEGQVVELEIAEGAGGAQVSADREALVQALLNLLSNAAKYGAHQPVTVRVAAPNGEVRLAVSDRGPGIAPAEQKRIFREFYRAPEARQSGVEGTGLGLALVKRHVEAHGGRIEIESAPGKGATFTIVLPRTETTA